MNFIKIFIINILGCLHTNSQQFSADSKKKHIGNKNYLFDFQADMVLKYSRLCSRYNTSCNLYEYYSAIYEPVCQQGKNQHMKRVCEALNSSCSTNVKPIYDKQKFFDLLAKEVSFFNKLCSEDERVCVYNKFQAMVFQEVCSENIGDNIKTVCKLLFDDSILKKELQNFVANRTDLVTFQVEKAKYFRKACPLDNTRCSEFNKLYKIYKPICDLNIEPEIQPICELLSSNTKAIDDLELVNNSENEIYRTFGVELGLLAESCKECGFGCVSYDYAFHLYYPVCEQNNNHQIKPICEALNKNGNQ